MSGRGREQEAQHSAAGPRAGFQSRAVSVLQQQQAAGEAAREATRRRAEAASAAMALGMWQNNAGVAGAEQNVFQEGIAGLERLGRRRTAAAVQRGAAAAGATSGGAAAISAAAHVAAANAITSGGSPPLWQARKRTSCVPPPPKPKDSELFLAKEAGRGNATAEAGGEVPAQYAANPWLSEAYRDGVEARDGHAEEMFAETAGRESIDSDAAAAIRVGTVPRPWRRDDSWATHYLLGQATEALRRFGPPPTAAPRCRDPDGGSAEAGCVRPLKEQPGLVISAKSSGSGAAQPPAPTEPPDPRLWGHDARSDKPTPPLLAAAAQRSGGVIAVLLGHNDDFYWRMLRSVCRYLSAPHAMVLFWTEAEPPPGAGLRRLSAAVVNSSECLAQRQVWYVFVPVRDWNASDVSQGNGDASLNAPAYHRMCWFWHNGIFHLPVLERVPFLMRLDSDSEFGSAPAVDPIHAVRDKEAVYGFNTFCFDNPQFTKGLWFHVRRFLTQPGVSARFEGFSVPPRCQRDPECSDPVPMFYTNFEVMRLSWFREEPVSTFLRSCHRGVFLNRWGDAPLRAVTLGMYATRAQVLHLNDFAYSHGRPRSMDGTAIWPASAGSHGNDMDIEWERNENPWWTPGLSDEVGIARLGLYYAGICFRKPTEKGSQSLNCDRWQAHCAPPAVAPLPPVMREAVRCPTKCDRCPADCSQMEQRRLTRLHRKDPEPPGSARYCVMSLPSGMRSRYLRWAWCSSFGKREWPQCAARQATRDWQLPDSVTNGSFGD